MPYPYSYTHEVDLGLWGPERALDSVQAAAAADGMKVAERAPGRILLDCPFESLFGPEERSPTIVPMRLELTVVGEGPSARLRARATFGAALGLGASLMAVPWLGAFIVSPRAAVSALPTAAACAAFVWLLLYLLGMLGARVWVRRRLQGAVVR